MINNYFDVIVVGNSILGLSTAFALLQQDPKIKIAIIGPEDRSGSASGASGAMINCFGEITNRSFSNIYNKEKFNISHKALEIWPKWLEEINSQDQSLPDVNFKKGTHVILNSKSGQLDCETYNSILSALKEYNEPYEEINPNCIAGLHPVEDARPLRAVYLPQEGYINSATMMKKFEAVLKKSSTIHFINDKVQHLNIANFQTQGVTLYTGKVLYTEKIVLAAGAFCQNIINKTPELKEKIPLILSGVGYSLTLETEGKLNIDHTIRTPNRAGACGLHAFSQDEHSLYIGASNNIFLAPQTKPNVGLMHFILECAMEQINEKLHSYQLINWHVGNRPVSLDTFPLIGSTSVKGLYLLTGTYREGFHQSPLLAQHIANLIMNKEPLISPMFSPERKLIKTLTPKESIEEGIIHYMAGAYERAMKLPKAGWDSLLREVFEKRLTELYQEFDTDFGFSPDILMMFEFSPQRTESIQLIKKALS